MNAHRVKSILLRILAFLGFSSFLFSPACTSPAFAQSDTVRFDNISTEQGLSQSTVNAILQDRQGFLWFATEGGLNQYDGYQFSIFQHDAEDPGSLSNNIINTLFADQKGELWIGTSTGLDRLDESAHTFMHYGKTIDSAANLANVSTDAIAQTQPGSLWIGTGGGGLCDLNLATNQVTRYSHDPAVSQSISNDHVNAIFVSPEGEMWVGTDGGLDRFDPTTGIFIHYPQSAGVLPALEDVPVRTIYEDGQHMMWIGTRDGLAQWDRTTNRWTLFRHDPNDAASLSDDSIKTIYEDSQGVLWIGSLRGLNQYDRAQKKFIRLIHDPNNPFSISSDYTRSIFEDRSRVLWIGTADGGLNKYARSTEKFILYSSHSSPSYNLSDNNIWAGYTDQSSTLWIGTFFSGLNRLDLTTGKLTIYQHDPSDPASLSDNEIRAIAKDRNGVLWIGTEHGGLNRLDPGANSFTHYQNHPDDPGSLSSDLVFSVFEDGSGRLWIGMENGGLDQFDAATGTFIHFRHDANDPTSLSDNSVRAIYQDHTGALWVGTENGGLNLWNGPGNHFKAYLNESENPSSLSNNWIASICEDQSGALWIGTFGGGLNRFDRSTQTFTHYSQKDGLPDDTIFGILADADGNLWLSTNKGLSKLNPATGTFRNYDISDGLQGNQFNPGAYFQAQDGEMFFGGAKGLNAFYPRQVKDNPIPPPVVITDFKKFNQTLQTDLAPNQAIQLSYQDDFIAFDFSALDFNAPAKNQYAYQLEGVDQDWVNAGTRRYASYTNLAGGDYVFRVKASNNDGVWNEQATTLQIHITPPFWQTWWFIGLIALVVGGGSAGGYWLRIRDIQARNRQLEKRVAQRTHELAVLNAISAVVNRSLDLTAILNAALEQTMSVMKMDIGLAYGLAEPETEPAGEPCLRLLAHRGVSEEYADLVKLRPLRSTLVAQAIETGKPALYLENAYPDPAVKAANDREGIRMAVSLPLLVKGELVGTVTLAARVARPITPEELSLLDAVGQQVAMAVMNARLYEQAEQTAITAERSRLARELHDSVTQLLYSVTLYAEAASELLSTGDTETAAGHLRDLRDTAQEALREMRLLIFELHRPAFGTGGLAAALQARLDAVETRGGIHAELRVEGTEQIARPAQAELYNIAHEALNNVLKHAHASHVKINLRFGEKETVMEICDDGVGFEPAVDGMGGGFGIPGMFERAQKIGGKLQIDSTPGQGTCVRVIAPVNTPEILNRNGSNLPEREKE